MLNKSLSGGLAWLQVVVYPLLLVGWANLDWHYQLVAGLILCLALALAEAGVAPNRWLLIAGIAGIVACIGQWRLLPLVAAQVLLGWLMISQTMTFPIKATVWLGQSLFLQITLTMLASRLITTATLIDLALVVLPLLVALWSAQLPGWLDIILIVLIGVAGFLLQHLTIISACGIAILAVLASERVRKPTTIGLNLVALASGLLIILTRLHG